MGEGERFKVRGSGPAAGERLRRASARNNGRSPQTLTTRRATCSVCGELGECQHRPLPGGPQVPVKWVMMSLPERHERSWVYSEERSVK